MPGKSETDKQLELKLKGVMEFYLTTYFEYYAPRLKDEIQKQNFFIESDMMDQHVDAYVKQLTVETSTKFHDIAMLVLDSLIGGREESVRQFEVLFLDLLKRTLLKEIQERRDPQPIAIVIADPDVKEN